VAIKCKNSNGEYESKAVGELQSSGAFSVPVSVNLADCVAQLHSAAGTPCPGQEPSRITPLSDGTFVAVPGKTQQASSAVCASVTICGPIKNYFHEHFHKKEEKPEPSKPEPEPKPQPEHQPPTPTYGSPTTPIYHPPAMHTHLTNHFHKDDELEHFFDHFHKKPVVPPKPEPQQKPQPEHQPPTTPTYGSATPTNGSPTPVSNHAPHMFDHFYKGHHHHHFFDYFHKKRVPPEPKPEPKPQPENHPPVQTFGSPPPLYHPPAKH